MNPRAQTGEKYGDRLEALSYVSRNNLPTPCASAVVRKLWQRTWGRVFGYVSLFGIGLAMIASV